MKLRKIILALFILAPNMIDTHQHTEDRPTLSVRWLDEDMCYQLQASYFKEEPLFKSYDAAFFNEHLLPQEAISYRNDPAHTIEGSQLAAYVEELVEEVKAGKRHFTHFDVLKASEFNRKQGAGLLVAKFKDYPFVVKLFAESPESFLQPYGKGFKHGCMSVVSGGLNRYLAGFGRVKNLDIAKQYVAQTPEYAALFDFPRKWFYLPKDTRWFELKGNNFNFQSEMTTQLPNVYAIITDEISSEVPLSKIKRRYGQTIFSFCRSTSFSIDPNIKNFRYESASKKLVIIDTEYFTSLLGFNKDLEAAGYFTLHVKIGFKAIRDCLSKSQSRQIMAKIRKSVTAS